MQMVISTIGVYPDPQPLWRERWRPGPAPPNHRGSWRRPPREPRAEPCCGFLTTSPQTTEQPGQAEAVFLAQPAVPCCLGSAGSGIPKSLLQTLRSAPRQHHPGTNRNLRKISSPQQQPCCGRSQLPVRRLWRRQSPKLCHDGPRGSFFWLQELEDELSVPSHPQPPRGSWQLSVVTPQPCLTAAGANVALGSSLPRAEVSSACWKKRCEGHGSPPPPGAPSGGAGSWRAGR